MEIDKHIQAKFAYLPSQLDGMNATRNPLITDSHLPCDMFNIIACEGGEDKDAIENAIEHFRKQKLPFCVWVGFDVDPPWLCDLLKKHGLKNSEAELAMGVDLKNVVWPDPIKGFTIKPAENIEDVITVMFSIFPEEEKQAIETFFKQASSLLQSPQSDLKFLIGYFEGRPVATSSAFFSHGLSSVFDVIVDPACRGRGFGKMMTLAAMHAAFDKGVNDCILTATNDAKFLYEKIGFHTIKQMWVYA